MVRHKVWLKMSVKAAIIQRKRQKTWGSITQDQKDYNKAYSFFIFTWVLYH